MLVVKLEGRTIATRKEFDEFDKSPNLTPNSRFATKNKCPCARNAQNWHVVKMARWGRSLAYGDIVRVALCVLAWAYRRRVRSSGRLGAEHSWSGANT